MDITEKEIRNDERRLIIRELRDWRVGCNATFLDGNGNIVGGNWAIPYVEFLEKL